MLRRRRNVAKPGRDGAVEVLLDDYPYAEDGLLIWDALKKWNDGYLVGGQPAQLRASTVE